MRTVLTLVALLAADVTRAAEPPSLEGAVPVVALAQATSRDGKVVLTVKQPVMTYREVSETVQVEVVKNVGGKDVKELVPQLRTKKVCVCQWDATEVRLGDPGVSVTDATGKAVGPDDVLKRLEKEAAILRCVGGPAAPFHTQTTKPDTLILVTPIVAPVPAPQPPAAPAAPKGEFEPSATEQDVIDRANAERKKAGAPPLIASPLLLKAARQHAANMARQDKLDHTLDGKGVAERLNDVGHAWSRCGENIAWGQRTPAEAIDSWMNSPGHRGNLLGAEYTQIGVAVTAAADGRNYWAMVLVRPR